METMAYNLENAGKIINANEEQVGWYVYNDSNESYGFRIKDGKIHHWCSRQDFIKFLEDNEYTVK